MSYDTVPGGSISNPVVFAEGEDAFSFYRTTLASVNIYYKSFFSDVIQEQPLMLVDTLISNLGSFFGLFTGASILSLIELVELSISILFVSLFNRSHR